MGDELEFSGLSIAPKVFETMVTKAAEGVEGVASVGVPNPGTSPLFSLLGGTDQQAQPPAVGVRAAGDGVQVAVRLTAFFGYPFVTLAQDVREAVAQTIQSLTSIDVVSVDVFIDALVFPKE
ncbi:Asp23/Gls24 family envelope stress response protein [bacterium]|nr:Asp23/Gls24 family envelope stress response protein [bacterium]